MASTQSVVINKNWRKITDNCCVIQPKTYHEDYLLYVGDNQPTQSSDFISIVVEQEGLELLFNAPTYLRLPDTYAKSGEKIVIIQGN